MTANIKLSSMKSLFVFTGALLVLSYWSVLGVMSSYSNENPTKLPISAVDPNLLVKHRICHVNLNDTRKHMQLYKDLNVIYYITPTYPRPEQMPELTRLSHTLMHVPRIHWIVADDQPLCSDEVLSVLKRSGLPYTHLSSPKPQNLKGPTIPRGVANRQAALAWIRDHVTDGILYFGDDDNTVDLRLFDEIRKTKKVSMFPVGLIGEFGVSAPLVKNGKVVGFFDSWPASRTFPVDMAGFAVNIKFLKPTATMPYIAGYEEDKFLISLGLKLDDIEPLAENCTQVLVWHTRTMKCKKSTLKIDLDKVGVSKRYDSFVGLIEETVRIGMADVSAKSGLTTYVSRNRKVYHGFDGL